MHREQLCANGDLRYRRQIPQRIESYPNSSMNHGFSCLRATSSCLDFLRHSLQREFVLRVPT